MATLDPNTTTHDPHEGTDWVDRVAYPFESHCIGLSAGAVHYIDEGESAPSDPTVVFLHGNPTWSFLYRHLVSGLSDDYRCVALDYLGFGLSEHPEEFSYLPSDHAAVVEEFVETLELEDVVLVVQDWGGPIGLSYVADHPENVRGLVVMNTWAWPMDDLSTRAFSWLAGGPLGRILCVRFDAFTRLVMLTAYADRSKLTPEIHEQYRRTHPPGKRTGTWVFPRAITGEREWLADLWKRLDSLRDHPALLAWGMEDPAFDPEKLRTFEVFFRNSETVEFPGVGHYIQEEAGEGLVPPVRAFLDGLDGT
jgi:haloalkane dehalogenase